MSERLLRLPEVLRRVPYGRSMLYRKISRGEFPSPCKLGDKAVAWLESEVEQWIRSRVDIRNSSTDLSELSPGLVQPIHGMSPQLMGRRLRCAAPPAGHAEVPDVVRK